MFRPHAASIALSITEYKIQPKKTLSRRHVARFALSINEYKNPAKGTLFRRHFASTARSIIGYKTPPQKRCLRAISQALYSLSTDMKAIQLNHCFSAMSTVNKHWRPPQSPVDALPPYPPPAERWLIRQLPPTSRPIPTMTTAAGNTGHTFEVAQGGLRSFSTAVVLSTTVYEGAKVEHHIFGKALDQKFPKTPLFHIGATLKPSTFGRNQALKNDRHPCANQLSLR